MNRYLTPPISLLTATVAVLASLHGSAAAQTGPQRDTTAGAMSRGASAGDDRWSLLPYTRRGYVGINVGRPEFDVPCGAGGFSCDDPEAGVYVYTGGLVNDLFGLEVGYLNSGRAERAGGRTRAQGLNLSAVLRLQSGGFNAFAKGGAIYGQTRVSVGFGSDQAAGVRRGWGGSYGFGLGYDFTPNAGIVAEWSRHEFRFPGTGRRDMDMTSLGYVHRF